MTIRARLIAAIVLTVLGPVVTIGVALSAFGTLGDRFDDVQRASAGERTALDLKFAVTDMNGWQTAYGYDDGRSRPRFEAAAAEVEELLAVARRQLPGERSLVSDLDGAFRRFMDLDAQAWQALEDGRQAETKRILLGPELDLYAEMARIAGDLADAQQRAATTAEVGFDDARERARRELVAVAIGAGVVIVLLLLTVQDVVRLALERRDAA